MSTTPEDVLIFIIYYEKYSKILCSLESTAPEPMFVFLSLSKHYLKRDRCSPLKKRNSTSFSPFMHPNCTSALVGWHDEGSHSLRRLALDPYSLISESHYGLFGMLETLVLLAKGKVHQGASKCLSLNGGHRFSLTWLVRMGQHPDKVKAIKSLSYHFEESPNLTVTRDLYQHKLYHIFMLSQTLF